MTMIRCDDCGFDRPCCCDTDNRFDEARDRGFIIVVIMAASALPVALVAALAVLGL
jgi:hypothetical protein